MVARREADVDLKEACALFERAYVEFEKCLGQSNDDGDEVNGGTLANTLVGHAEALSSRAYLKEDRADFEPLYEEAIVKIEKALSVATDKRSDLLQEWASVLEARADKRAEVETTADADVVGPPTIPDYSEALAKLEEALEADPTNASAWYDRAELLMTSAHNELMAAAVSLDDAPEGDEEVEYPEAVQQKIWQLYTDARAALEKACEHDKTSTEVRSKLGDLCSTMGRLEISIARPHRDALMAKAEECFREANKLDEEDVDVIARLAQCIFYIHEEGKDELNDEVDRLLESFRDLGGDLDDLLDDPEIYEEEFIARVAPLFPEQGWEDAGSDDDDDDE